MAANHVTILSAVHEGFSFSTSWLLFDFLIILVGVRKHHSGFSFNFPGDVEYHFICLMTLSLYIFFREMYIQESILRAGGQTGNAPGASHTRPVLYH